MPQQSAVHHTFAIERSFPVTPDRVFSAFSDPARKRLWFAEGGGRDVDEFEMDFRVGGKELALMRFKEAPMQGILFTNTGTYLDIVPDRRLVAGSSMAMGDMRISVSLTTFEFLPTESGTDLLFTHQGVFFEGSDGPERREGGWQKLLERLSLHI